MDVLSRDKILASVGVRPAPVPVSVPELGGTVYVRTLNAGERARMDGLVDKAGRQHLRAIVAASCCCDESGQPLFADADIPALEGLPARALDRVVFVADRLNALGKAEIDALGEPSPAPAP